MAIEDPYYIYLRLKNDFLWIPGGSLCSFEKYNIDQGIIKGVDNDYTCKTLDG